LYDRKVSGWEYYSGMINLISDNLFKGDDPDAHKEPLYIGETLRT